jgi:hypothetical protein
LIISDLKKSKFAIFQIQKSSKQWGAKCKTKRKVWYSYP